jgi:hypothetical protein
MQSLTDKDLGKTDYAYIVTTNHIGINKIFELAFTF